ncbi:hypothetical protein [Yoonia sp.]|uniref:hypothetical protein n=1 Tax=Yoonia sp. TaxID=2212373 RepID=UPI003F6B1592
MTLVATIAVVASGKPTTTWTISLEENCQDDGKGDAYQNCAGMITNGNEQVTEKFHPSSCQRTEAFL